MSTEIWTTLFAVGSLWLVAVIVPGPNLFILIQNALLNRVSSFFIVLGIAFGTAIWALSGLLGITLLFQTAPWVYILFKILGGGYLIYLGVKLFVTSFKTTEIKEQKKIMRSYKKSFFVGTLTNLSNPKTALFVTSLFVTTVPQNPSLILGSLTILTMVLISLFWYGLVAYFISMGGFTKIYNRVQKYIDRVVGTIFVSFGGSILFSK